MTGIREYPGFTGAFGPMWEKYASYGRSRRESREQRLMDTIWMARGSCASSDPEVFFPHDGIGVEIAKLVCADCTVTAPCLEYALANRVEHGVWGGCSERQRRRMLKARRAAARKDELVAVAA